MAKELELGVSEMQAEARNGDAPFTWSERDGWEQVPGKLAGEVGLTLYVDKVELATMMCTPERLNHLVVGFLRSEGLIEKLDDIALMRVCDEELVADVRLMRPAERRASARILTSGCGGGVTFDPGSSIPPVTSALRVSPAQILAGMRLLQQNYPGHGERAGLHLAGLYDGEALLAVARDIGRHNTLDKIWGECLFRDISTEGRLLLATGRLSSEMMTKAARMGVPVVVSLNSPTDRGVRLAREVGITVVGYARAGRLTVYSHPERLRAEVLN